MFAILLSLLLSTARADDCKSIEFASKNIVSVDGNLLNVFRDADRVTASKALIACNEAEAAKEFAKFDEHFTKARRRAVVGAYAGVSGRPLISATVFTFASIRAIRANHSIKRTADLID